MDTKQATPLQTYKISGAWAGQEDSKFDYSICCIGAGYVGGPTMAVLADNCPNIKVTVADISQRQVDRWNSPSLPVYEPGLQEVVERCRGRNLFFTTDRDAAVRGAEMIFVSVNTPTKTHGIGAGRAANLKNWEMAARHISEVSQRPKIVIEKSTLPVRTAESMKDVLDSNGGDCKFQVLSNPEFLAEGTAIRDLQAPDRVLIGGLADSKTGLDGIKKLEWVYSHWIPVDRILTTNLWSAELAKLVANAFLAQRISSINSISALCEKTGANVTEVARAIGMDTRIGSRFLNASVGFGGSCFKKDILNLVYICECLHLDEVAAYWNQVVIMNSWQKTRFAHRMISAMHNTISGKSITIFGFAFKKNTGDTRESAAIDVCKYLLKEFARIRIYDPKVEVEQIHRDFEEYSILPPVGPRGREVKFDDLVTICSDPYKATEGSHAIAVITEWDEFKTYDYQRILKGMQRPAFIFDGRNILDAPALETLGFRVYSIGRPQNSDL